jgi:hypothetical protein
VSGGWLGDSGRFAAVEECDSEQITSVSGSLGGEAAWAGSGISLAGG